MSAYAEEIALLKDIVKVVGKYQLSAQKKLKNINIKSDKSPVTEVDINCERIIKERISAKFPDDGFLGEESGECAGKSARRWIIDPLDGTRPYIRGIPTYSVLIALEDEGVLSAGVAHFPALSETYWATRGGGAFCGGEKLSVSKTAKIAESMASALGVVEEADSAKGKLLLGALRASDYFYGFMDAYSYVCVAAGRLDFCVSLSDKPWDRAPAALIVKEAGGVFCDTAGNETIYGDDFIVSNRNIHERVLDVFS